MIQLLEINHYAGMYQVAAETIEKDYMISWILFCLSKSTLNNYFTFYGGTAIKRMYFEDHRFSEDIDLITHKTITLEQILTELNCLKYAQEEANILLTINKDNIIKTQSRIQMYINYSGYEEIIGAPKEIRIDFAMEMDSYGKVIEKQMIKSYSDLKMQNINIPVMSLNTILANKLSLLLDITRNEPRDVYDFWFLLNRLEKFDFNFEEVRESFKERLCYYPNFSTLVSRLNASSFKRNWHIRLNKQVSDLSNINIIVGDIIAKMKEMFQIQTDLQEEP